MGQVSLRDYNNSWYQAGRSGAWQMAWFLIGLPLLRCSLIPFSGLRVRLLKLFGAEIGERVVVKPGVRVKYPWHLRIGQDCWIGEDCWIDNLTTVRIGNDVCLSQGAYLCTGNHNWADPAFGLVIEPILIQNGAWVGAKAFLGPGVVLGHGAIAAAGSVVSKNIPDFKIYAGNPAVFVRNRLIGASKPATEPISTKERVAQ
jgi:putative colanic acid biosynthesis acetyltransferase WcaF